MKNVHIIPTDKPTGIFKSGDNLLYSIMNKVRTTNEGFHIYITSDEEIKEGDWVITNNGLLAKVVIELTWHFINSKKIILTTDQDLIKDGVQAIDDEFLEWFVKNPSCEKVDWFYSSLMKDYEYEIIIPKEELTISDVAKQRAKNYMSLKGALEPKQETLEEAAEIFVNNRFTKQICGDESYPDIYASKESIVESHIIFAKSQGKIMYSEEEIQIILSKLLFDLKHKKIPNSVEWFKQFKKK